MSHLYKRIAFQGEKGAFSHVSCQDVFPELDVLPCYSFEDAFAAVRDERADLAMIPVDNTIAGRVADVHHLMPEGDIFIIGEHFQAVRHNLLGVKGASIEDLSHVHSHVHAIPQCKKIIKTLGLKSHIHADTAGAAAEIAKHGDKAHAAIASVLAAEIYGLDILKKDIHDEHHNTTRFLFFSREPNIRTLDESKKIITSLVFQVRNIPAALYKSLGGFATNGFSLAKLESYVDENFQAAQFYCEVEGHPENEGFKLALEELGFYAENVKFLGAYPAHPFRKNM